MEILKAKLTETSNITKYHPLLKAASTSTGPAQPPGYILSELCSLSFTSAELSAHIVAYLIDRLRPKYSPKGTVKTLRSLRTLARDGSRAARRAIREHDEALRAVAKHASVRSHGAEGTTTDEALKAISNEIREYVFSEEVLLSDGSKEPEVPPAEQRALAGMGASARGDGKYEGFGNARDDGDDLGVRMADFIQDTLVPRDGRDDVMRMCLRSSTGTYEPVTVPEMVPSEAAPPQPARHGQTSGERSKQVKQHVPGRAGGGWESSSDSEEEQLKVMSALSVQSAHSSTSSLKEAQEAGEFFTEVEKEVPERKLLLDYIEGNGMPKPSDIENVFNSAVSLNVLTFFHHVQEQLKNSKEATVQTRLLLMIERLLRTSRINQEVYKTTLENTLHELTEHKESGVATKARKVLLIINKRG